MSNSALWFAGTGLLGAAHAFALWRVARTNPLRTLQPGWRLSFMAAALVVAARGGAVVPGLLGFVGGVTVSALVCVIGARKWT